MSNDRLPSEPGDFHLAVKRRDHAETPWRWEIWEAGKTKAAQHSDRHFRTMTDAIKEGKAALTAFVGKRFPDAA
jgi:hypothetical protein